MDPQYVSTLHVYKIQTNIWQIKIISAWFSLSYTLCSKVQIVQDSVFKYTEQNTAFYCSSLWCCGMYVCSLCIYTQTLLSWLLHTIWQLEAMWGQGVLSFSSHTWWSVLFVRGHWALSLLDLDFQYSCSVTRPTLCLKASIGAVFMIVQLGLSLLTVTHFWY